MHTNAGEIRALTGLRGVAALWVMAFHAGTLYTRLDPDAYRVVRLLTSGGFLGVDVFFVLSGFVLAYTYAASLTTRGAYFGFLWKRLARIYPLHLATLALFGMVGLFCWLTGIGWYRDDLFSMAGLVQSLTLTHAWDLEVFKTWNINSWSISAEWAAYLLFPVIAVAALRIRSRVHLIALVAALFALFYWYASMRTLGRSINYAMPRIAVEFTAGVLLYRLWVLQGLSRSITTDRMAACALLVLLAAAGPSVVFLGTHYALAAFPVVAAVLVYALAASHGRMERVLSHPYSHYLGRISYSIYLVHGVVIFGVRNVLHAYELRASAFAVIAGTLVLVTVTLALSDLLYRTVEVPARAAMLRWLGNGVHLRVFAPRSPAASTRRA
jgi:peptidoglycan/LPS O-acetylase OafA/YrhL